MFRIRQIADPSLPLNRREIEEVQRILQERLPGIDAAEIDGLPDRLRDPVGHRMRAILLVADDVRGHLLGFALLSHVPDVGFCLLDYIATGSRLSGGGVGGALYKRVRDVARRLGGSGLFFECLPDSPADCSDPALARGNAARLRFYERFGARPIVGTGYETPLSPGQKDMPHLVYDDLDSGKPLRARKLKAIVKAILERKYGDLCSPEYNQRVLDSIKTDPVVLRAPKYGGNAKTAPARVVTGDSLIALVVNDRHDIHHVRERGYVESPVRVKSILDGILPTGLFWTMPPREFAESHITAVHDRGFVEYLKRVCATVPSGKSVYPYVFPIRNHTRPPKDHAYAAGYYCIDTFTPLNKNAWLAAKRAVDCTLTAAHAVLGGQRFAYALVRPPGHHAESRVFGGFCYFCNAAVAAHALSAHGRVAILDLDYHHGNGQQEIFYRRADVFTVSIHGHPRFAYPFFTGFPEETGEGEGEGFNLNLPMPEKVDGDAYRRALRSALSRIKAFQPSHLVVSLGLDTAKGDPTGTWSLSTKDLHANGTMIAALELPTLVVQEGGYRTSSLGSNAAAFFLGLAGVGNATAPKT
ncbi:MAG: histone deacetylase family protein [Phycisphaerales bacterium]|nr:histone deacetylase family protein [Phycisphaerales bacterium]